LRFTLFSTSTTLDLYISSINFKLYFFTNLQQFFDLDYTKFNIVSADLHVISSQILLLSVPRLLLRICPGLLGVIRESTQYPGGRVRTLISLMTCRLLPWLNGAV
jgi:hypothetical protein